jgi:hypothetical protein
MIWGKGIIVIPFLVGLICIFCEGEFMDRERREVFMLLHGDDDECAIFCVNCVYFFFYILLCYFFFFIVFNVVFICFVYF